MGQERALQMQENFKGTSVFFAVLFDTTPWAHLQPDRRHDSPQLQTAKKWLNEVGIPVRWNHLHDCEGEARNHSALKIFIGYTRASKCGALLWAATHPTCTHFWVIEYDVLFVGNWHDFVVNYADEP